MGSHVMSVTIAQEEARRLADTGGAGAGEGGQEASFRVPSRAEVLRGEVTKEGLIAVSFGSLAVGSRVESNYEGKGVFYPGIVSRCNADDETLDISFDDGDTEVRVPPTDLRLPSGWRPEAALPRGGQAQEEEEEEEEGLEASLGVVGPEGRGEEDVVGPDGE